MTDLIVVILVIAVSSGFFIYGFIENYKKWFPKQQENDTIEENKGEISD
jgi:tetrahydromethanopterin S-methyltransferase subunit H